MALKGPDEIAQGEALGCVTKHSLSPERAWWESVRLTDLAGRKSCHAMPPFQGGNWVGIGFPGLRPGLSHSAPSGPGDVRALNLMPLRFRGDDDVISWRRQSFVEQIGPVLGTCRRRCLQPFKVRCCAPFAAVTQVEPTLKVGST